MSDTEQLVIDDRRRKARGAQSNQTGRFDVARVDISDGWDIPEERAPFETVLHLQDARSMIVRNTSPDIPFDRSINPYRGCEHGCIYCFARPTHAYLGLSPGLDFETQLIARPNAAQVLESELRRPSYRVAPLAIGTNTDPYQPVEGAQTIMRQCLEVLSAFHHPVTIVTKGTLIERDADILGDMAQKGLIEVGVSITTLDHKLARAMEPRVPSPARRLKVIKTLARQGIPTRVMVSPVVPGLTDHEAERILELGAEAGATSASWIMLRLPREVSDLFQEWLVAHVPDRATRVMGHVRDMHGGKPYDADWGRRMHGTGPYAKIISARMALAMKRNGLNWAQKALRSDLFALPPKAGDQLSLF